MSWLAWFLEIGAGLLFFRVALPWLQNWLRRFPVPCTVPLPDSDRPPSHAWVFVAVAYAWAGVALIAAWLGGWMETATLARIATLSLPATLGAAILANGLAGRWSERPLAESDPWYPPLKRLADRVGIRNPRVRITPSLSMQPRLNLLGEILLPSALLRIASPEEVAILATPLLISRRGQGCRLLSYTMRAAVCALLLFLMQTHRFPPQVYFAFAISSVLVLSCGENGTRRNGMTNRAEADCLSWDVFGDRELLARAWERQGSATDAERRIAQAMAGGGRP